MTPASGAQRFSLPTNAQRFSVPTLLTLGAAGGIALTLTTGVIALRLGLWAAPSAVAAHATNAAAADDDAARQRAQLTRQNNELRRSLLDALARASACGDVPAPRADSPSALVSMRRTVPHWKKLRFGPASKRCVSPSTSL